jgi:hypothetical protein
MKSTLEDCKKEINEIINDYHWLSERVWALDKAGYSVGEQWVKAGGILSTWYLKRKRTYRVQVGGAKQRGNYSRAYCVDIYASE